MAPGVRSSKLSSVTDYHPLCFRCFRKAQIRLFSSSPHSQTRLRQSMFRWLNGPGAAFRDPLPGSTNYLSAYGRNGGLRRLVKRDKTSNSEGDNPDVQSQSNDLDQNFAGGRPIPKEQSDDMLPFPMNRQFSSQPVLSEEFRDEIYRRVTKEFKSVRTVSAELGVDMQRVGAVVRLKTIENDWVQQGKPLAAPYARAVNSMLPTTSYDSRSRSARAPHESINDLPVHSQTLTQLFHPVPESTHFSRTSAARVFSHSLLPAEKRIPHPELVELTQVAMANKGREDIVNKRRQELEQEEVARYQKTRAAAVTKEEQVKKVENPRWQFRFEDIKVERVGRDGRAREGVGARYGVPPQDRKKGQIKIPTKVE